MSLSGSISDFFNKDPVRKDKDNVLIVSIFFLTQERGWISVKRNFGVDDHFVEYKGVGGAKLTTTAIRNGKKFDITFEGFGTGAGASSQVKDKICLDMDQFVDDKLQIINEELLRVKINSLLQSIENRIT